MDAAISVEIDPALEEEPVVEPVERAVEETLRLFGDDSPVELAVLVTTDETIRVYNKRYLGRDTPTDVLAFGTESPGQADAFVGPPMATKYLGDVMVSYERAVEQAADYGHTPEEELHQLVIHGVLHLLGYDDAGESERTRMRQMEKKVLERLGER